MVLLHPEKHKGGAAKQYVKLEKQYSWFVVMVTSAAGKFSHLRSWKNETFVRGVTEVASLKTLFVNRTSPLIVNVGLSRALKKLAPLAGTAW